MSRLQLPPDVAQQVHQANAQSVGLHMIRLNIAANIMAKMIDVTHNEADMVERARKATQATDILLREHGYNVVVHKRGENNG